eukprot:COSAG01_NODE_9486_length_2434_cov_21.517773_3_plen_148_part_01
MFSCMVCVAPILRSHHRGFSALKQRASCCLSHSDFPTFVFHPLSGPEFSGPWNSGPSRRRLLLPAGPSREFQYSNGEFRAQQQAENTKVGESLSVSVSCLCCLAIDIDHVLCVAQPCCSIVVWNESECLLRNETRGVSLFCYRACSPI